MTDETRPIYAIEELLHHATIRGVLATVGEGLDAMIETMTMFDRFVKRQADAMPANLQQTGEEIAAANVDALTAVNRCKKANDQALALAEVYGDQLVEEEDLERELELAQVTLFWNAIGKLGLAMYERSIDAHNASLYPLIRQTVVIALMAEGRLGRISEEAAAELIASRERIERQKMKGDPPPKKKTPPRRLH